MYFLKGYKHVSEMSDEALFIHNVYGTIFDVNKIAEEITGYSRRELLEMNVRQLHPESELKKSMKAIQLISTSEREVDFDSQFQKKSGKIIDVRIIGDRFTFKRKDFVIGLVTDITPYKKISVRPKGLNTIQTKRSLKGLLKFSGPLSKAYTEPAQVLIEVAESRDLFTMEHSAKVTGHAIAFTKVLGLSKRDVEIIRLAAMFHDIGKIGIRAQVLMKNTKLTEEEYKEVQRHPTLSAEIIKGIKPVKGLLPIIRHHHENYDGTGYPDGLKGGKIPLGARVLSIIDVYDALTSARAYREAYSYSGALSIMKEMGGKKFDPALLERFFELLFQQKQK